MTEKMHTNTKKIHAKQHISTKAVHGGSVRSRFGETSEALFLNSGYCYDCAEDVEARFKGEQEGYVYTRFGNPTVEMFETRTALMEGAEAAHATSSGMAAITAALLSQLNCGDHVVSAGALFGSSLYLMNQLLPRFGIKTTIVNGSNLAEWKNAARSNTKLFFLETPTNPTLEILNIKKISEIAHKAGAKLIIDNVFATPVLQKPLKLGADIVVYSSTKHMDGQGRTLGGVVLGESDFINGKLREFIRQTGSILSPFNAWVMLKGLETLEIRVERSAKTASVLADFLTGHEKIERVIYPFKSEHPQHELAKKQMKSGGSLLTFVVKGGKEEAFTLMNSLDLILISNNLGDSKTLVSHPATTTHQKLTQQERNSLGISDGMLRISTGLEDAKDLQKDLEQALSQI